MLKRKAGSEFSGIQTRSTVQADLVPNASDSTTALRAPLEQGFSLPRFITATGARWHGAAMRVPDRAIRNSEACGIQQDDLGVSLDDLDSERASLTTWTTNPRRIDGHQSQSDRAALRNRVLRRHANQSQPVRPRAQHIISIKSDFIKKSDVAKIGSVSIRTVENWTKNGLLPYLKIKGIVRYRRKDVEDALDAFIVNPRTRKREPKN